MALHPDFNDLLAAFAAAEVQYLIVGGYAVGFHARPRFTKDIDVWIGDDPENLRRVRSALTEFGAPPQLLEELDHAQPEDVLWMGVPPLRIDLLKGVPGGCFADAYSRRVDTAWGDVPVSVIGLDDLIAIKRASNRPQDLLDLDILEATRAG
jgi:hypothetical protein